MIELASSDQPTQRRLFEPTSNVSRATFEYVLNNPRLTRADVVKALGDQGFNKHSVSSLLSQFVRQNRIGELTNRLDPRKPRYIALASEYTPLKDTRPPKAKRALAARVNAPRQINPDRLLDTMTVQQARDLYSKLQEMFRQ